MKHSPASALVATVLFTGLGCATSAPPPAVDTTTTTGGEYGPEAVELYVARRQGQGACPQDVPGSFQFAPGAAELTAKDLADIEKWAACLNRPALAHATVVLVGGEDPNGPRGLFLQRAERIRAALIRYNVDPRRIVIGGANVSRGGGAGQAMDVVAIEVTTTATQTMRAIVPRHGPLQTVR